MASRGSIRIVPPLTPVIIGPTNWEIPRPKTYPITPAITPTMRASKKDDPNHMGFPETDGAKDADLPLPFIHRSHHVGEDDQAPDEEDNDRYPDGEFLENDPMPPSLSEGSV